MAGLPTGRHRLLLRLVGVTAAALALVGPTVSGAGYGGRFETAQFQESGLAHAVGARGPLGDLFGEVGPVAVYMETESGGASWTVHPDGLVVLSGRASWPDARDAFAAWHADLGLGPPTFDDLRITTRRGVLDRPAWLVP